MNLKYLFLHWVSLCHYITSRSSNYITFTFCIILSHTAFLVFSLCQTSLMWFVIKNCILNETWVIFIVFLWIRVYQSDRWCFDLHKSVCTCALICACLVIEVIGLIEDVLVRQAIFVGFLAQLSIFNFLHVVLFYIKDTMCGWSLVMVKITWTLM